MMRLEPSAPLNLLTYTVLYLSLVILYVNFGSDKRGKPILLVICEFSRLVDDITNFDRLMVLVGYLLRPCGNTINPIYDLL